MPIDFPKFSDLDFEIIPHQLTGLLSDNLQKIEVLLKSHPKTFDDLFGPLEDIDDALEAFWSPISHLHAVSQSSKLRACYLACLPKLSEYHTKLGHHVELYRAICALDLTVLTPIQQKIVRDARRDFELSGIHLCADDKALLATLEMKLTELSATFENHVLDATEAFEYYTEDSEVLRGLPAHILSEASSLAAEKKKRGFLLNLEFPCYLAVMTHAENEMLRKTFYDAWVTRASDEGPFRLKYDNGPVMQAILRHKFKKASLLGFENYAALSLAPKMAKTPENVAQFLENLYTKILLPAKREMEALSAFAKEHCQMMALHPWDLAFVSEKMREKYYAIHESVLRAYFPEAKVLDGLFSIIQSLYGVSFKKLDHVEVWHNDVRCFELLDAAERTIGFIYLDLYARPGKRGGAWMDVLRSRRLLKDGSIQWPIATLTTNFTKPTKDHPLTLTHDEVVTLFHEFGHCLHHLLTRVDYRSASGIHGVEWDAVELPSQIFENWCYEPEALLLISEHIETKEPLQGVLLQQLIQARTFQAAMHLMRQLEFAWFDFELHHMPYQETKNYVMDVLCQVRKKTKLLEMVPYNRFPNSFSHIFAGGYDAGYYSYLWAEVLSSDAFSKFKETGILNPKTGQAFLEALLSKGSAITAKEAFIAFLGREPQLEAFLTMHGIHG